MNLTETIADATKWERSITTQLASEKVGWGRKRIVAVRSKAVYKIPIGDFHCFEGEDDALKLTWVSYALDNLDHNLSERNTWENNPGSLLLTPFVENEIPAAVERVANQWKQYILSLGELLGSEDKRLEALRNMEPKDFVNVLQRGILLGTSVGNAVSRAIRVVKEKNKDHEYSSALAGHDLDAYNFGMTPDKGSIKLFDYGGADIAFAIEHFGTQIREELDEINLGF